MEARARANPTADPQRQYPPPKSKKNRQQPMLSNPIDLTPPALQETPQQNESGGGAEEELNLRGMRRATASERGVTVAAGPTSRPLCLHSPLPLRFRLRFGLIELQLRPFGLYLAANFFSFGVQNKSCCRWQSRFYGMVPHVLYFCTGRVILIRIF